MKTKKLNQIKPNAFRDFRGVGQPLSNRL